MRWLSVLAVSGVLAAAGPAQAHQFLDYFEYGAVELSARGYQTAATIAHYVRARAANPGDRYRILISAHMDTAEIDEFSAELSRRRAQSMADELVKLGLDPSRIELRGHGADQLARATGPGVREPLNRRLSVDVNFQGRFGR